MQFGAFDRDRYVGQLRNHSILLPIVFLSLGIWGWLLDLGWRRQTAN